MPRNALGRGLGALIRSLSRKNLSRPKNRPHNFARRGRCTGPRTRFFRPQQIDIDVIEPSPYQPRTRFREEALDELARSIKSSGSFSL